MKSIAAAMSAAMFSLLSCVNLSTGGNEQTGGGNSKDDTPSSKDDEPKKDESGDVYVLESAYFEHTVYDGVEYTCFEKPVYITPEWSAVPVLQSCAFLNGRRSSDYLSEDSLELGLVYSYPSNVLVYEDDDYEGKILLTDNGYNKCSVESFLDDDGKEWICCQYDSKDRLAKLTWFYRDGAYEEEYANIFSYDDHSRLSEIRCTSVTDAADPGEIITFEYTAIPSKTVYPLQSVDLDSIFSEVLGDSEFCIPFMMSGLMGKSFSDCLLKSVKYTDTDEDSYGEEYSYILDANGYVKEMTTRRWKSGGRLTTDSSSFNWKKL